MSGDLVHLDRLERTFQKAADAARTEGGAYGVNPLDALALVSEVRRLRAEIDRRDAADEFREGCERFDLTFGDDDAGVSR